MKYVLLFAALFVVLYVSLYVGLRGFDVLVPTKYLGWDLPSNEYGFLTSYELREHEIDTTSGRILRFVFYPLSQIDNNFGYDVNK